MGGWDSKPSYPPSAIHTVSLKATAGQRDRWETAAQRRGMARGAFIAWAADMAVEFCEAYQRVTIDHEQEMHPERFR
jgi:hypothetical protein